MSNQIGWAGRLRGLFNDTGPWGPSTGDDKRPPRSRPRPVSDDNGPWGGRSAPASGGSGISSLEDLLRRSRARFGGGGDWDGGFGGGNNRNYIYWGVIGFIVLWLLFTSFHRIAPEERGVVTRFGRYNATVGAGFTVAGTGPLSVVFDYNGNIGGDKDIHGISGGLRLTF